MARRSTRPKRWRWGDLLQQLEEQPPRGCYTFCGPELYLKRECLTALKSALVGGGENGEWGRYALHTFRGGETALPEIVAAASQAGLFGAEGLVLIDEAERLSRIRGKQREAWLEFARSQPPNPVVFASALTFWELGRRSRFLADLVGATCIVEFWHLFPRDAVRWIVQRAAQRGLHCSPQAAAVLVAHLGTDLFLLAQEIEKISLLQGEEKGELGIAQLRDLVQRGLLGSSWECVAAAIAGKTREVLARLQSVRREEESFSFAWKLTHGAGRGMMGEEPAAGGARGHRGWGVDGGGGAASEMTMDKKKLLGRLLSECYEWERNLKRGQWSGAHDYVALETVLIRHALRWHQGREPGAR